MYLGEKALLQQGVVPGSQLYTTAGSYSFTVPLFNTLTVHVWSGGGAGGSGYNTAYALSGAGGNSSAFGISVTGGGGGAGGGGYRTVATAGGETGNSTNGNITNISGRAGLSYYAATAFRLANTIKAGGRGANGGAGGPGAPGGYGGSNGGIGIAPGGGGGASYFDNGSGAWAHTVSGGGGGYGQSQFTNYTYVPGTTQTIVVGVGGTAADGDVATAIGGNGAPGQVLVVWS